LKGFTLYIVHVSTDGKVTVFTIQADSIEEAKKKAVAESKRLGFTFIKVISAFRLIGQEFEISGE
jgi:hypothetical protein